jgi:uncharacterized protein YaaQ
MRLVFVVVHSGDVDELLRAMTRAGIAATQIEGDAAVGRNGLATVIAGVEDDVVADVVTLVHATARGRSRPGEPLRPIAERAEFWVPGPIDHHAGGASIYVLPIRRFERIGYA